MKNVDDLLDKVKEVTGSDYRTAKDLSIANQLIGNWRGRVSMPSNKHVIEMCKIAKIDLGDAIIAIEYSRENERPLKEAGFSGVGMMLALGFGSLGTMTLIKVSSLPYDALTASFFVAEKLYIMLNYKNTESAANDDNYEVIKNRKNSPLYGKLLLIG